MANVIQGITAKEELPFQIQLMESQVTSVSKEVSVNTGLRESKNALLELTIPISKLRLNQIVSHVCQDTTAQAQTNLV